ncbi:serine hydrolase domain-containing protein [Longimicrobium sp.]|uniref:serine hydrolase domain-containing protein n=1 Tax=Longimicrobium sp. TaxID=2029185 RepID=UPI002E3065A3|nr:serine hydrolase domain-containing protein [Longimicrobium sp.]HEX6042190.1 serine hydrolase domain-containing protein [Longimicrobium sp.]
MLLPLAACGRDEASARTRLAARVDSLVAAYQRETWAPGVSVAVLRGRDTLVYRGYGLADVENDVPATPGTVYRIGSITKQFTAALVLQLVEQGRVSLDDPIGRYVADLPDAWSGVRVRHLLNHTGGLPGFEREWLRLGLREEALTPDSVIGLVRDEPLEFAPGTAWKYSNIGYTLLGRLIERVTGERYADALEWRILRPLGLNETRYCDVAPLIRHRAAGYQQRDTGVVNAEYTSMTAPYAAGGLCSTVGDLAAWNRALAGGRVVGAASWRRMTTPDSAARASNYGYGVVVTEIDGHTVIRHNGGIQGFRADNAYVPGDSLSVTVLTNLAAPGPGELLLDILRAALENSPPSRPSTIRAHDRDATRDRLTPSESNSLPAQPASGP